MSRQRWESEADRICERRVADYLGNLWGCEMVKQPDEFRIDFKVMRGGKLKAVLEVKCRNLVWGQYPDGVKLGVRKHRELIDWMERGVSSGYAVRTTEDEIWVRWYDAMDHGWLVKENDGRTVNTRDDGDIEDCVYIPWNYFKRVKGDEG